jgi:hypothetical protein
LVLENLELFDSPAQELHQLHLQDTQTNSRAEHLCKIRIKVSYGQSSLTVHTWKPGDEQAVLSRDSAGEENCYEYQAQSPAEKPCLQTKARSIQKFELKHPEAAADS